MLTAPRGQGTKAKGQRRKERSPWYRRVSGKDWKLTTPSPTPEGMAKAAFFGTDDLAKNPWTLESHRAFRRQWHRAALDFLGTQPAEWKVTSAWLWSFGSFDVHGFEKAEFRDEEIVKMVREHNAKVPRRGP